MSKNIGWRRFSKKEEEKRKEDEKEEKKESKKSEKRSEQKSEKKSKKTSAKTSEKTEEKKERILEDQVWYHGTLPRMIIEELLREDGMFLVRVSEMHHKLRVIISVKWNGHVNHVPVLSTPQGQWHLEGEKFASIYDLVRYHHQSHDPITKSTGAILNTAVKRERWMLDDRNLRPAKKLGEGAFGEVWLGYLKRNNKEEKVAYKSVKDSLAMSDRVRMETVKEAKIMIKYKHPNVVNLFGIVAIRPPIRIVMEYCPAGSLDIHLKKQKRPIVAKVKYCVEAARGMEYLVSQKCIHRDLAARNCLIGEKGEVKISDFGLSRKASAKKPQYVVTTGTKVPVRWTAPEALMRGTYSEVSDVYSFGVLMWEIFADGEMPWPNIKNNQEVVSLVKSGKKMPPPLGTPPQIYEVMLQCWELDPEKRILFEPLVKELEEIILTSQTASSSDHSP